MSEGYGLGRHVVPSNIPSELHSCMSIHGCAAVVVRVFCFFAPFSFFFLRCAMVILKEFLGDLWTEEVAKKLDDIGVTNVNDLAFVFTTQAEGDGARWATFSDAKFF